MEQWAIHNKIYFNRDKCEALTLDQNKQKNQFSRKRMRNILIGETIIIVATCVLNI